MRDDPTLAEIVTERPSAAPVLERHGLDYCCDGWAHLSDAAAAVGLAPDVIAEEILALPVEPLPDWAVMDVEELVEHIVTTHHGPLRAELARLEDLAVVVEETFGHAHPVVVDLSLTFARLRATLVAHLGTEESTLFPALHALGARGPLSAADAETVASMLRSMRDDHETVAELLDALRAVTGGYRVFDGADLHARQLYDGLAALDADTRLHLHKENNVLDPAVELLMTTPVAQRP